MNNRKILMVDDDEHVLRGFRRLFSDKYELTLSTSAEEGISYLKKEQYAVLVSDYQMPEIDGVRFLSMAATISPDTVRVMLTGQADLRTAVEAVNQGHIYRFLTKPCDNTILLSVLKDSVNQYRLKTVEKEMARREHEMLEKTLQGSIRMLIEILSLTNPELFALSQQIRKLCRGVGARLEAEDLWELELAGMLFHIGLVTLPQEIGERYLDIMSVEDGDRPLFDTHPRIARKLILNIPRLENVAESIGLQLKGENQLKNEKNRRAVFISKVARTVTDFKILERLYKSSEDALKKMRELVVDREAYDIVIVEALEAEIFKLKKEILVREVGVEELKEGMILAGNIFDENKSLILAKGTEVTEVMCIKLRNFAKLGRNLSTPRVFVTVGKKEKRSMRDLGKDI